MAKAKSSKGQSSAKTAANNGESVSSEKKIDAIDVLKAQHREVEDLFEEFEKADSSRAQKQLATTICEKLTVHATIEEELYYPEVRKGDTKDMVLEAAEEHLSVKRIIADIQELKSGDERLEAKVKVLQEQVSHHVEEEEDELFPKSKKVIDKEERLSMGQQLLARTAELEAERNGASGDGEWNPRLARRDQPSGGGRRATR